MTITKLIISTTCFLLTLLFHTNKVEAGENGGSNYLPGFYGDFAMGDMPGPGTYFNNFFLAYTEPNGNTGTALEMPGLIHVSSTQFLGAQFLAGIFPGILATFDHSNGQRTARVGLADSYLMPLALNWHWQNIHILAFEGIIAPTGRYEKDSLSSGRNIWTFDHNLAITWNLPKDNELSITAGYMNNLKNTATNYRSGDEIHLDYTVGHYLRDGLALGITGSYHRQISADSAPQDIAISERGEAATIGPVLLFTPKLSGQEITMSLKWMHEYLSKGRPAQEYLLWRLFMEF